MSPWTSIWIKTKETIDQFKNSKWAQRQGLLVFLILGINGAAESRIPSLVESSSKVTYLIVIIIVGTVLGILIRIVWTNLIFFFGKVKER
jgi:hypothetical protein